MAKVAPAGAFRQRAKFAKRKGARGREASVGARHGFAIDQGGEKMDSHRGEEAPPQIGDQNEFCRYTPASLQQAHGRGFVEMVKRQRTEHDVILSIFSPP